MIFLVVELQMCSFSHCMNGSAGPMNDANNIVINVHRNDLY